LSVAVCFHCSFPAVLSAAAVFHSSLPVLPSSCLHSEDSLPACIHAYSSESVRLSKPLHMCQVLLHTLDYMTHDNHREDVSMEHDADLGSGPHMHTYALQSQNVSGSRTIQSWFVAFLMLFRWLTLSSFPKALTPKAAQQIQPDFSCCCGILPRCCKLAHARFSPVRSDNLPNLMQTYKGLEGSSPMSSILPNKFVHQLVIDMIRAEFVLEGCKEVAARMLQQVGSCLPWNVQGCYQSLHSAHTDVQTLTPGALKLTLKPSSESEAPVLQSNMVYSANRFL